MAKIPLFAFKSMLESGAVVQNVAQVEKYFSMH